MIVTKFELQITPELERAVTERLKLKRGEFIYRVHVLVGKRMVPKKRKPGRLAKLEAGE